MESHVRLDGKKNHRMEDTEYRNRRYDLEELPIENNLLFFLFINLYLFINL